MPTAKLNAPWCGSILVTPPRPDLSAVIGRSFLSRLVNAARMQLRRIHFAIRRMEGETWGDPS